MSRRDEVKLKFESRIKDAKNQAIEEVLESYQTHMLVSIHEMSSFLKLKNPEITNKECLLQELKEKCYLAVEDYRLAFETMVSESLTGSEDFKEDLEEFHKALDVVQMGLQILRLGDSL